MKKDKIIKLTLCAAVALTQLSAFASDNEAVVISDTSETREVIVGMQQITVNGEAVDFTNIKLSQYIFDTNGVVMVPLRAVAEKMGYTVEWNEENQSVAVSDDKWETLLYIGEDNYVGVSKIAIGMTAPQSYGSAPVLFEDTTFVPAKMFELMGYDYHAIGQFVDFTKVDAAKDEREYSADTLIVTPASDAKEADILKLFEKNGLEVVYKTDTLNMYTVKIKDTEKSKSLDEYIADLESDKNILSVSKDYIMHLDDPVQMPNPFTDYKTADEAKKALSFNPSVPSYIPEGYETDAVRTMGNDFFEIIYRNADGDRICYRTAEQEGDISGDYNVYKKENKIIAGKYEVTVKGNENIACAVWDDGKISYSVFSDKELSENEIEKIIESVL